MNGMNIAVGVVGMGLMGERHAAIYHQMSGVQLVGVADVNADARARAEARFGVQSYADARALFARDGLDAVSICLPDSRHREATLAAFDAALHVLLEKPLATSVAEGEQIVRAARQADRVFLVGHLLRFDPRYDLARQRVRGGDIGRVAHVYARRNSAIGAARRYGDTTGLVWHVSVHDVDLIRWVTGREIVRVAAQASDHVLGGQGHLDSLLALLSLDDGTPCAVESCWILPAAFKNGIDAQLEVVGTAGALEVTGLEQGLRVADQDGIWYPDTMRFVEYDDGRVGGILKTELEHFIACVRTGQEPRAAGEDALAALRVAAALEASLVEGRTVTVGR